MNSQFGAIPRQNHTVEMDQLHLQANRLVDKASTIAAMKSPRFQNNNQPEYDKQYLLQQTKPEDYQYTFQSSRAEIYENRPLQQSSQRESGFTNSTRIAKNEQIPHHIKEMPQGFSTGATNSLSIINENPSIAKENYDRQRNYTGSSRVSSSNHPLRVSIKIF